MDKITHICNRINEISKLTDLLRYGLEPWSKTGLRGTRGCIPGEKIDRYALALEDLDYIERDIRCIRSYLEKEKVNEQSIRLYKGKTESSFSK